MLLKQLKNTIKLRRVNNYENSKEDIYVSNQNIKKYNLRRGDKVKAIAKPSSDSSPALQEVLRINDLDPTLFLKRENFDIKTQGRLGKSPLSVYKLFAISEALSARISSAPSLKGDASPASSISCSNALVPPHFANSR